MLCCFSASSIAFLGISEYRANAAGGTVSPLSEESVLATFGQSFDGWYLLTDNGSRKAVTWDYFGTFDFSSVHTTSDTITYYSNLGCKIFLYRADVSGLGTDSNNGGANLGVDLGVQMQSVTDLHFMCGFMSSTHGGSLGGGAVSEMAYTLDGAARTTNAIRNDWGVPAQFNLYYDASDQSIYKSAYFTMQNTVISGSAAAVNLISSESTAFTTNALVDDQYSFFYIVSPVVNDDVQISGGGGTNIDLDVIVGDIKDIMSSNNGILSQLYDFVVTIPETILDGLQALFIPTEEDLEGFKDDADDLLHETFGGLYDAEDMVHDGLSDIPSNSKSTITFPGITVSQFSLPAQEVPIRPAGFDVLFDTLATVIDIIATFAFLNMLKHKLSKILGGGDEE